MAAGILLLLLLEDGEYGAEIYGAASKYEQASLVFHYARGMVRNNPALDERCQIFKGQAKAIQLTDDARNVDDVGVYRVISAEHNEGHGHNMSGGVIDELHLQAGRDLGDSRRASTASGGRDSPRVGSSPPADCGRGAGRNRPDAGAAGDREPHLLRPAGGRRVRRAGRNLPACRPAGGPGARLERLSAARGRLLIFL